MIDVDKWWAYVDDLIRDLICLLCYVRIVIAWCVWNGGQYSCDVSILGGMVMDRKLASELISIEIII